MDLAHKVLGNAHGEGKFEWGFCVLVLLKYVLFFYHVVSGFVNYSS
jgi:hypothetical protein